MIKKKNLYAVILAGGSGTRFWPVSREKLPKQFVNILDDQTLFQKTLVRVHSSIPAQNTFILTNAKFKSLVKKQMRGLGIPDKNIMLEPSGKNTAPAICWAASRISNINPDGVMVVLPSDHLIEKKQNFLKVIRKAVKAAEDNYLVTFGIKPTRPETGYGYLQLKKTLKKKGDYFPLRQFREKPDLANAKRYVSAGNYFWNSGIFVWKASVILNEFQKYCPKIYHLLSPSKTDKARLHDWKKLPSVSIDYGVLEKSRCVAAVVAEDIGWSDLGSWQALYDVLGKDKIGNSLKGDVTTLECQDSLIHSQGRCIAAYGLKGMAVIDTGDCIMVCPLEESQKVKDIVGALKKKKRREI